MRMVFFHVPSFFLKKIRIIGQECTKALLHCIIMNFNVLLLDMFHLGAVWDRSRELRLLAKRRPTAHVHGQQMMQRPRLPFRGSHEGHSTTKAGALQRAGGARVLWSPLKEALNYNSKIN